jgi:uncharacterized protein DUF6223
VALTAGLIGTARSGLFTATAGGGPGTGNGLVGSVAAVMLGLISTALGWLSLSRSRRTG